MKQYVAEVTAAHGVTWLNCLPSDHYTKDLIHRLKHRGIQFVTGRPTSTARVAANTSQNLAPFFKLAEFIMSSSIRSVYTFWIKRRYSRAECEYTWPTRPAGFFPLIVLSSMSFRVCAFSHFVIFVCVVRSNTLVGSRRCLLAVS